MEVSMDEVVVVDPVMAKMPRGGPNASWLDQMRTRTRQHERNARTAVGVVADISHPRILPAPITAVFSRPGTTPTPGNDTAPHDSGQS
jgi:hypothetical protein